MLQGHGPEQRVAGRLEHGSAVDHAESVAAVLDRRMRGEDTRCPGSALQCHPYRIATRCGDVAPMGVLDGKHFVANERFGSSHEILHVLGVGQVDRHADTPSRPTDRSIAR